MNNFDRDFKRTKTGVGIIFVVTIFFVAAITVGAVIIGVKAVNAIKERGLKDIAEQIWEGPDNE